MKNSSRFELKMERNFTRSSRGTLGSCASSRTRRLNSSHDNSRLTNASGPISPSTVERFVEKKPVPHPSRAHQPHHHLSAARGGHGTLELSPNPHAEDLELSRPGSLLAEELARGSHCSQ